MEKTVWLGQCLFEDDHTFLAPVATSDGKLVR